MDLADRLRRLGYKPAGQTPAPPSQLKGEPLDSALRGEWRENEHGRCYVCRQAYPAAYEHGGVSLDEVSGLEGWTISLLGRERGLAQTDFSRIVFLDTETTGLAGGTGTYVFLVGLGYFENEFFVVEQYFMADFGQEQAMLRALTQALARFDTLATFNGKVFDWPLLQTRYAMARQRPPLSEPNHLDLLFPARRIWRERLGSCSLSSLEEHVLRVSRQADVPGWLIPSIYFQFVRDRDASPLRPVFSHNAQDILSLVALTVRLGGHLASPTSDTWDPIDTYATGRVFESAEEWEQAVLCYESALSRSLPESVRSQVSCRLGMAYKRLRRRENAVAVWRSIVDRPDAVGTTAHVELAKHLEHKERDFAAAAAAVQKALNLLNKRSFSQWGDDASARQRADLHRRLRRLEVKMAKESPAGTSSQQPDNERFGRTLGRVAEDTPCV